MCTFNLNRMYFLFLRSSKKNRKTQNYFNLKLKIFNLSNLLIFYFHIKSKVFYFNYFLNFKLYCYDATVDIRRCQPSRLPAADRRHQAQSSVRRRPPKQDTWPRGRGGAEEAETEESEPGIGPDEVHEAQGEPG